MLWLNFAPLITLLQEKYGVSELAASVPTLVFPLFYVFLSLHAGSMVDHRGFKYTVSLGGIIMAVFSVIRIQDAFWAIVAGQVGIAIGQPYVLNGITTWLEQILVPAGISADQAGLIGGMFIIGGIVGAIAIPVLSDRMQRRKPFLVLCVFLGLVLVGPLCQTTAFNHGLVFSTILGFFFLPAYALLLAMSEELAGRDRAGMETGILMLVGNAGGVVVIIAMDLVKNGESNWQQA